MRRLLPIVCIVVFADTLLFAAVIPLVPVFADAYGLSKLEAGLLVGAYGAGAMVGGIPAGFVAVRAGPKRTVVAGLLALAVASALFAVAGGPLALGLTRFAQGITSAVTWCGALAWLTLGTSRERRGRILGTAFGFAVLGFIVGPVVGAVAVHVGVQGTFLAVAGVAGVLTLLAGSLPAGTRELPATRGTLRHAFADRAYVLGVWLTLVPALFFGAVDVLAPLAFDAAGWGSVAIAGTFVVAGVAEVLLAPAVGILSDRRGRLYPMRLALWGLVAVATGLALSLAHAVLLGAALVVLASVVTSFLYTPGIALISDRAEATGMPQTLAFGVMNTSWAFGAMVGPAGGGALADLAGDAAPFLLIAALALGTALLAFRPGALAEAV